MTTQRDYEDAGDCQPTPGSRCINEFDDDGSRRLLCVEDFSCSAAGEVLVEGLLCAGAASSANLFYSDH